MGAALFGSVYLILYVLSFSLSRAVGEGIVEIRDQCSLSSVEFYLYQLPDIIAYPGRLLAIALHGSLPTEWRLMDFLWVSLPGPFTALIMASIGAMLFSRNGRVQGLGRVALVIYALGAVAVFVLMPVIISIACA
jgi:hypothetical protein